MNISRSFNGMNDVASLTKDKTSQQMFHLRQRTSLDLTMKVYIFYVRHEGESSHALI